MAVTYLTSDYTGSQTLTLANDYVLLALPNRNVKSIAVQVSGTWTGTISFTGSLDATNFTALDVWARNITGITSSGITANDMVFIPTNGLSYVRVQFTTASSGAPLVTWNMTDEVGSLLNANTVVKWITPGTSATALAKAEDAASVNADTGVFVFSIRRSTITGSPTSTTGDYQEIVTGDDGQLGTRVVPSTVATGFSSTFVVAAASNNATNIKASAGALSRIIVANSNAAIRYLKFYNKATAPTVGTDTPVLVIGCQPSATTHIDLGINPFTFPLGIGFGMVTGATNADNTAVAAADLIATMYWV